MQKSCLLFLPYLLIPQSWSCLLFALPLIPFCFVSSRDIPTPVHSVVFICFALVLAQFSCSLNFSAVWLLIHWLWKYSLPHFDSRQIMILNQEGEKLEKSRERRKEGAQPFSSWAVPWSTGVSNLKCRVKTDWKRNTIPSLEDGITAHCLVFNEKWASQPCLGQRRDKGGKLLKQSDCRLSSSLFPIAVVFHSTQSSVATCDLSKLFRKYPKQLVTYCAEWHKCNSQSYQHGYATSRNWVPKANIIPVAQLDRDGTSCTVSNSLFFFFNHDEPEGFMCFAQWNTSIPAPVRLIF